MRGVKTSLLHCSMSIITAKAKQTLNNTYLNGKSHLFSKMLLIGFIFYEQEGPDINILLMGGRGLTGTDLVGIQSSII